MYFILPNQQPGMLKNWDACKRWDSADRKHITVIYLTNVHSKLDSNIKVGSGTSRLGGWGLQKDN